VAGAHQRSARGARLRGPLDRPVPSDGSAIPRPFRPLVRRTESWPLRDSICPLVEQPERQLGHEGLPQVELSSVLDLEPPEPVSRIFDAPQVRWVLLIEAATDRYPAHPLTVVHAVLLAQGLR
jgi:hypothetical protein